MDWKALQSEECPKCGEPLDDVEEEMIVCSDPDCDFKIRQERLKQILEDMDDQDDFQMYGS